MQDAYIDYSDIPELGNDFLVKASKGPADFLADREDDPPEERKSDISSWRIENIRVIEDNAIQFVLSMVSKVLCDFSPRESRYLSNWAYTILISV